MALLQRFLGDPNRSSSTKQYWPLVDEINGLEDEFRALSDEQLRAKTDEFRAELADGASLDDILPDAFAAVREAHRRLINQHAHDVQLIGAAVLHNGKIAEMKTGEGKTLVASIALYLNALTGEGCHLVTVNDYLARRDAQWYGRSLRKMLGVTVGIIQHDASYIVTEEKVSDALGMEYLAPISKREAYGADITYGTNNEFGFDYLRDNMVQDEARKVQRGHHYSIVDEVDNILIDEARTPLIISGAAGESATLYQTFARLVPRLQATTDYEVDEKHRSVTLTEEGNEKVEKLLGIDNIYSPENYRLTRYLEASLKAQVMYQRDVEYVVRDGEVIIVDEFTGRMMPGRRYSEGLHQAIEAKEGVQVRHETVTHATITLQNYFRVYDKLAGMTGTAVTQAEEFNEIYKLEVVVIPTNRPMVREDFKDYVFRTETGKFNAVVEEIEDAHAQGQPVLVGTVSIEKSEYLADLLRRTSTCDWDDCARWHKVCSLKDPAVLNAKQHEKEALIVSQAGKVGAVTIATNMAGRGTDIILGGNPVGRDQADWQAEHNAVVEAGGLHVVGTERHEARRIDNQLRGRSGRQGDPGSSRFCVSFEDEIMRRFAPEWLPGMMSRLGMTEDMPLESGWVSKAIETAQSKVEGHNFDIRKRLVEYDDVNNQQRKHIYAERDKILAGTDLKSNIVEMVAAEVETVVDTYLPGRDRDEWDFEGLAAEGERITKHASTPDQIEALDRDEALDRFIASFEESYAAKEAELEPEVMRAAERIVLLKTIDSLWIEHLTELDDLRSGIGLRAYGGADPVVVFKREARDMWDQLLENIRHTIARNILNVTVTQRPAAPQAPVAAPDSGDPSRLQAVKDQASATSSTEGTASAPVNGNRRAAARQPVASGVQAADVRTDGRPPRVETVVSGPKVGRNSPCPCGSGRKYKKCHGLNE
ncbi:MAG: preprotein translocase subunit SecA [Dehalococcoidia bacterium]|nr:preprotein translocase subunit SecA [Dehalococcoidia bacterium]